MIPKNTLTPYTNIYYVTHFHVHVDFDIDVKILHMTIDSDLKPLNMSQLEKKFPLRLTFNNAREYLSFNLMMRYPGFIKQ